MESQVEKSQLVEWREKSLALLLENPPYDATDSLIWLVRAYFEELNSRTEITTKSAEALKSMFK